MEKSSRTGRVTIYVYKILAIAFWIIIWEVASRWIDKEVLLASPWKVCLTMLQLIQSNRFWQTIAFSSLRIIIGFLLAVIAGIVCAALSYRSRLFEELVSPLMKVIKATPVASFIILALIWIHSRNLSVLITFLMVLPMIYANILQGLRATDQKLLEMAFIYRIGWWRSVKAIYIPAVLPFFLSAVSVGLGFGFKAGIAAEVIGIPTMSIGERLYEAKLYLMTKELLAWSIIIILISVIFEKAVMSLIQLIQYSGYRNITEKQDK